MCENFPGLAFLERNDEGVTSLFKIAMSTTIITAQVLLRSLAKAGKIEVYPERFLNLGPNEPLPGLFLTDKIAIYAELVEVLKELAGSDQSLLQPYQQLYNILQQLKSQL